MKRIAALLLTLLLLGGAAVAQTVPPDGSRNAVCVDGERVYLLAGRQLWAADDALESQTPLLQFDEAPCAIAARDGEFCIARPVDGGVAFQSLNADGAEQALFTVAADCLPEKLLLAGDALFVLWAGDGASHPISGYALTGEPLALPFAAVTDAALSPEYGLVYALPQAERQETLRALDWRTGDSLLLNAVGDVLGVAVAPDGELYFRTGQGLWHYRAHALEPERISAADGPRTDMALSATRSHLIVWSRCGALQPRLWDAVPRRTLTLANLGQSGESDDETIDLTIRRFQRLHPDVRLQFEEYPDFTRRVPALADGDSAIDVMLLDSHAIHEAAAAGLLYDLNADAGLRGRLEGWSGQQLLCMDGIRAGVPHQVYYLAFFVNELLAPAAPEAARDARSWAELFRAAERFSSGAADAWLLRDDLSYPVWLRYYLAQFASAEDIRFDCEAFRSLAAQYRRAVQSGAIVDQAAYESAVGRGWEQSDWDRVLLAEAESTVGAHSKAALPPPLPGERRVVLAGYSALVIRNGSANVDLALDFLKCHASDEVQYRTGNPTWLGDAARCSGYGLLDEAERQRLLGQKALLDQATDGFWRLDYAATGAAMDAYLAGESTLDELVAALQALAPAAVRIFL